MKQNKINKEIPYYLYIHNIYLYQYHDTKPNPINIDWLFGLTRTHLSANINFMDCKRALFDMGPLKAPGEDGYPALFFQKCWDTIADSLFNFVSQVWINPSLIS